MQLLLPLPLCLVLSGVSCWSSGTRCLSPHTHSESQSTTHFGEVSHWERNTAASHHGSCSTAALPFPCAPWTCQAGTGGHGRPATSFLITQFPFSPYPPWVSGHVLVLLTCQWTTSEAEKMPGRPKRTVSPASLQPRQAGKAQPWLELNTASFHGKTIPLCAACSPRTILCSDNILSMA